MIKKLSALTFPLVVYLSLVIPAYAANVDPCPDPSFRALCGYGLGKVQDVVRSGVTILLIIATIASIFFLIYGGIKWITSGGDKANLESARTTIIAAAIGLALSFLSFFIVNVVLQFFGLNTIWSFAIPTL